MLLLLHFHPELHHYQMTATDLNRCHQIPQDPSSRPISYSLGVAESPSGMPGAGACACLRARVCMCVAGL